MIIRCPDCGNDNQSLFEKTAHLRHQMNLNCSVCSHSFVIYFEGVKKEEIIPKGVISDKTGVLTKNKGSV